MTLPALTPPAVLARVIACALAPFCDSADVASEIACNVVQALVCADGGASPQVVIADAMLRRARHVRHVVRASELGARAYAVAERPSTPSRVALLRHYGVTDAYQWLADHGLLEPVRVEAVASC